MINYNINIFHLYPKIPLPTWFPALTNFLIYPHKFSSIHLIVHPPYKSRLHLFSIMG